MAISKIFIDLSSEAVKRSFPSGLNRTEVIFPKTYGPRELGRDYFHGCH